MEGVSLYPSWEYEELPLLFFKGDCLFTKEETISFKKQFAKAKGSKGERYRVTGTGLYSFEKTKEISPPTFDLRYDTSSLNGKYA